jgi:hypothetical protein
MTRATVPNLETKEKVLSPEHALGALFGFVVSRTRLAGVVCDERRRDEESMWV